MHRPALDRPGADEGDLDDEVVEAASAAACGNVAICARLSTWKTPTESPRHEHLVDGLLLGEVARSTSPWWAGTRSTARWIASSIPRPRRSNFTRPTAAQSSLSHCSTVRPPCAPTRPGRPPRPGGRRSPCRPGGCRDGGGNPRARWRRRAPRRDAEIVVDCSGPGSTGAVVTRRSGGAVSRGSPAGQPPLGRRASASSDGPLRCGVARAW